MGVHAPLGGGVCTAGLGGHVPGLKAACWEAKGSMLSLGEGVGGCALGAKISFIMQPRSAIWAALKHGCTDSQPGLLAALLISAGTMQFIKVSGATSSNLYTSWGDLILTGSLD